MDRTTEDLFRAFRDRGDADALGEVFDRLAPGLFRQALHVTRNPQAAEDALQATFVTAIEKRAVWDGQRPLAPWLAGILARHARRLAGARRRAIAVPDSVDTGGDPAEEAARRETVALVRERAASLPAHERRVVLLQLEHGLTPAEIAEVLDMAPGTVRMRLARALTRLRRGLPAGIAVAAFGAAELAAMRAALVARAATVAGPSLASAGWAAGASLGATVMAKKVVAAMSVVVAFLCVAWLVPWGGAPPRVANAAAPVEAETAALTEPQQNAADARRAVEVAARADAATGEEKAVTGTLRVRVLRDDGRPLAGAVVVIRPHDGGDDRRFEPGRPADAEGLVEYPDVTAGRVTVETTGRVRETAVVGAGTTREIELRVPGMRELHGVVVDAEDRPVPHAEIVVHDGSGRRAPCWLGRADAAGRFEVPVDELGWVGARAPGYAPSWLTGISRNTDFREQLRIALPGPGATIEGCVVDAEGAPMAGARVRVGGFHGVGRVHTGRGAPRFSWLPVVLHTDERGRFRATDVATGDVEVLVIANGHAPATRHVHCTAGVTTRADFDLRTGARVTGAVLDPTGTPVADAHVWIDALVSWQTRSTRSDARGRFALDGLAPERVVLRAKAIGHGEAFIDLTGRPTAGVDVVLRSQWTWSGQLVDPDGQGVELDGYVATQTQDGDWSSERFESGRLLISGNPEQITACRVSVHAGADRMIEVYRGPVPPPDASGARTFVVDRRDFDEPDPESGHVRGRLVGDDGWHDTWLVFDRSERTETTLEVDARTGRFAGKVPAGRYRLSVFTRNAMPRPLHEITVRGGEELDLGDVPVREQIQGRMGRLVVRLRRTDGAEVADPSVHFSDRAGRGGGLAQPVGASESSARLLAGTYSVDVLSQNSRWHRQEVEIRAGEDTVLDLELEPATRRYVVLPWPIPDDAPNHGTVRYELRDSAGRMIHDDELDVAELPYYFMPALTVGTNRLALEFDDGSRYAGTVRVEDLRPSNDPIAVPVTRLR